ncbi:Histone deacetylase complex subunit SAP30L-A, partial [Fragariocoptes setiger]
MASVQDSSAETEKPRPTLAEHADEPDLTTNETIAEEMDVSIDSSQALTPQDSDPIPKSPAITMSTPVAPTTNSVSPQQQSTSVKITTTAVAESVQQLPSDVALQSHSADILSQTTGTAIQSISTVIGNQPLQTSAIKVAGQSVTVQSSPAIQQTQSTDVSNSPQLAKVSSVTQAPVQLAGQTQVPSTNIFLPEVSTSNITVATAPIPLQVPVPASQGPIPPPATLVTQAINITPVKITSSVVSLHQATPVKITSTLSPMHQLQAEIPIQSQQANILSQTAGTTIQSISTVIPNQPLHTQPAKIIGQPVSVQSASIVQQPQQITISAPSQIAKVPNLTQGPIQLTNAPQLQVVRQQQQQPQLASSQSPATASSPSRNQGPDFKYVCCLLDDGVRCDRIAGNASYSRRVQKTVGLRKLNYTLDPNVRHAYICEHHKSMIQSARKSPANARETVLNRNHHLQEVATAASVTAMSPYGPQANNATNFLPQHAMLNHGALNSVADFSTLRGTTAAAVGYSHYAGPSIGPLDPSTSGYIDQHHHQSDINNGMDVDLYQLQVNTLRRYKRHFRVQTRPGLNKLQLAESLKRHFKSIPVLDKEAITYFVYMVKCNRNKLDHNVRCPTTENR